MRKHRSLGEMISTATFFGMWGVHIFTQHGIVRHRGYGCAAILGLPRLYFVYWVGYVSQSQILLSSGGIADGC